MQNPEQELANYRNRIFRDFSFLLNTRLRFLREFSAQENTILWDIANGGVTSIMYQSLVDNLIVTLAWLFSKSANEKRSLIWYLNNVKQYTEVFSDEEIEEQLERINNLQIVIDKIKTVRDKWVAHRDPAAFNNPEGFLQANEITLEDFQHLVNLAEEIENEHLERFEETSADFILPINGIERLTSCAKAKEDLHIFIRDVVTSTRRPEFNEIKENAVASLLRKQGF